ncbi:hypothetical protein OnM2_000034 [Erysiphe neolycopersici]|uniref:Uncharacterized protein n=1 Tax=Erysiphe neolycopersici TaxID=212602 RepID=A0A420I8L3_9PEZI|nr:hypothetical protein OnM2_000034 [Erysiphe neolycopersici]
MKQIFIVNDGEPPKLYDTGGKFHGYQHHQEEEIPENGYLVPHTGLK